MADDEHRGSEIDRVLAENQRYVEAFDRSALTAAPLSGLAILACMDARLDVEEALGLRTGDAHIIRNAAGLATVDAIRSLIVSQALLGTDQILVIQHTGCGLLGVDETALRDDLARSTGQRLDIAFGSFPDLEQNLRRTVDRLRTHAWLRGTVRGMIFEVETGRVREVV